MNEGVDVVGVDNTCHLGGKGSGNSVTSNSVGGDRKVVGGILGSTGLKRAKGECGGGGGDRSGDTIGNRVGAHTSNNKGKGGIDFGSDLNRINNGISDYASVNGTTTRIVTIDPNITGVGGGSITSLA